MTTEQPSPDEASVPADAGDPEVRGAVAADGQPAPGEREAAAVTPADDARAGSSDATGPTYRDVTVRRAPKFVPFMAIGAIVGFTAAFFIAYTGPEDPTLTRESILGFFTVAFAIPGLLLAALIVLVFDRRSVKRAERARAERTFDDE